MATTPTTSKPKIPTGISLLLKSIGVNPEEISAAIDKICTGDNLQKIISAVETLQRIENKIDILLDHFQLSTQTVVKFEKES